MRISDWSSDVCSSDLFDFVSDVLGTILSGYEIELGMNRDVEIDAAALGLALTDFAGQNARDHAKLVLGEKGGKRRVDIVDAPEVVSLLRVLAVLDRKSVV